MNQVCGNCQGGWVAERQQTVSPDGRIVYIESLKRCEPCQGTGKPPGVLW